MEQRVAKLFPDFALLLDEVAIGKEVMMSGLKASMPSPPNNELGPPPNPGAVPRKPSKFDQMPGGMSATPPPPGAMSSASGSMAQAEAFTQGLVGAPTPGMAAAAELRAPGVVQIPGVSTMRTPSVRSMNIPPTCNHCLQGYMPEAPAITFQKELNEEFFSQAAWILNSLTGNAIGVEVRHDDDWSKFPDIASSLKANNLEEDSFALALCPDLTKWGIGLAGSWKNRESAAKLALCLAIASETPYLQKTLNDYPCFKQMCVNIGLVPE
jgi:hypothetical protein